MENIVESIITCPYADIKRWKSCRKMPVSITTNAATAIPYCGLRLMIVACFAVMALQNARLSRSSDFVLEVVSDRLNGSSIKG